ncbi:MAG TPA: hypothetical protein VGM67_17600 [Gemmatimonadaceae bacterium]|jgi:hypothetical protein
MSAHQHQAPTSGRDTKAAFIGVIVGAIVLFGILRTIVYITNAHYNSEKPAATAPK